MRPAPQSNGFLAALDGSNQDHTAVGAGCSSLFKKKGPVCLKGLERVRLSLKVQATRILLHHSGYHHRSGGRINFLSFPDAVY